MPAPHNLRLGLNVDHVATIRNARGGAHPDPVRAAEIAIHAGVDSITAHLREDRRHITDRDLERLRYEIALPLNMEMAATDEMVAIALRLVPHACCLVPEKREERTTEGGLDVVGARTTIAPRIARLADSGIRVSLFIEPEPHQIAAAKRAGAPAVELHTGRFCDALKMQNAGKTQGTGAEDELDRLRRAARAAADEGLEVHAGHGIDYHSVSPIAALAEVAELNIGHFLIGEAVFVGLEATLRHMRVLMDGARAAGRGP